MLTLNAAFTEEFAKAEVEAVFLVQIYAGTADPNPYAFCTGNKGMVFSGIYNPFTGGTTGARDVYPLVIACTPINQAMDPYDRTVVKNSTTVTLANHPMIRTFIKDNRLKGRAITVKLGTRGLTTELHWAHAFSGVIEEINPRDDGIDLECQDFYRWGGQAVTDMWMNKHPLQVIKQLLLAQGIPSEYVDDDMFDPTHADYASTIGHYCVTHSGHHTGGIHGPEYIYLERWNGWDRIDVAAYNHIIPYGVTVDYNITIQDFVKILVGCLYFGEDGQVRFVRFDTTTAASVAWTDNDINEMTQVQTIIANQIEMSVTGERPTHGEPYKGSVTLKDTTSQSNYAYPGESVGLFVRSDNFLGINWHADIQSEVTTTGALSPLRVAYPFGLSGTRVNDAVYSNPWENMQDSEAQLSGSKPLYILVNDEVMKCISLDLVEGSKLIIPDHFILGSPGDSHKPMFADLTIASMNRGALNTTAAQHRDPFEPGGDVDVLEPAAKAFDVTMHRDFALTQLQRFSNGCEIIEVTTNLSQWAVQLADFVTVTNESFLSYGFDGIDSGHKWEVIGKELSLDDNSAHIKWKLAYATKSSPPAINATYTWPAAGVRGPLDTIPGIRYANEVEVGVSRHTVMGLGATSSGLNVTIKRGTAGCGSKVVPFKTDEVITVVASRDHYFSADLKTGQIAVQTVTTGAAQPDLGRSSVVIAKVVAGGSSCTITDLRKFGAVRPRNISTTDFEAGGNLVPNPDFETWSRGPGYPPDNWEVRNTAVVTWGTDAAREETTAYSGNYALNINLSSLAGSYVQSHPFRIERDRVYQFGISVKGSSTTAQCMAQIEWLTEAKAQVSAPILVNHNASADTTDMTRYDVFTTAPATAAYARVLLSKWSDASPENGIFDAIRMVRAMPSFFVTNTSQTLGKGANTLVDFDTEAHDDGDNFNSTLGQNKFTAPFDGVYTFSAQLLGGNVTNGHADSYLWLAKNGGELLRGAKSYTGTSDEYDYRIETGPIKLAAADYIQVVYYSGHASDSACTGSTTQNYFSGAQIQ